MPTGNRTGSGTQANGGTAGAAASSKALGAVAASAEWTNATANLAGMESECGNLTLVSAKPDSDMVIAGVALRGLHATHDGGQSWSPLGSSSGSDQIVNRPSSIVYDPDAADVFWESGIYNGGGTYKTLDLGATLKQLGDITHIDLLSIDLHDPMRGTMLAGGHEQAQVVHRSTDGGQTWNNVGVNLPPDTNFSNAPLVIDGETHLIGCCGFTDGRCGVWRTTDGGADWMQVTDLPVTGAPLWASDDHIYWALRGGGLAKSTDRGQSWVRQTSADGLVSGVPPLELPDGRIVAVGHDHLLISADGATSWKTLGKTLPFEAASVAYSAQTSALFISHWDCNNAVLSDAIMSAPFDYRAE